MHIPGRGSPGHSGWHGASAPDRGGRAGGFTLVEMLAVMAIMVSLMGLLGIGISQMTAQSARKSAVNLIMNSFEQARVAALRHGTNVYVVFADGSFPEDKRFRSFLILRDRLESDNPPASAPGASPFVVLTKWKELPRGISFLNSIAGNTTVLATTRGFPAGAIPQASGAVSLPTIQFNQTGAIASPVDIADRYLQLYEGYFNGSEDVRTMNRASDLYEVFSFARFTGRIRHEVSALN